MGCSVSTSSVANERPRPRFTPVADSDDDKTLYASVHNGSWSKNESSGSLKSYQSEHASMDTGQSSLLSLPSPEQPHQNGSRNGSGRGLSRESSTDGFGRTIDRLLCSGWLQKQPMKAANSRSAFSKWKNRFFRLFTLENILWLVYYEDAATTKDIKPIPLWNTSTVEAAGNPRILVICNNGPESYELIVQADTEQDARRWRNALLDAIETHACPSRSTAEAAKRSARGPNIHIIDDVDDGDFPDADLPADYSQKTSKRASTSANDAHIAEEAKLQQLFQDCDILENQTKNRKSTQQHPAGTGSNSGNAEPSSSQSASQTEHDDRSNEENAPPLPTAKSKRGGVLRNALVRASFRRSKASIRSIASVSTLARSSNHVRRFGMGFEEDKNLEKTRSTHHLRDNWVEQIEDIEVTDFIANGGRPDSSGENEPLVVIQVVMGNSMWFVKHTFGVLKTLSAELDIPLPVFEETEDKGIDSKKCVQLLNEFTATLKSRPQYLVKPWVQLVLQPTLSDHEIHLVANGGIMGWLQKKGRMNKAWKPRYTAFYCGHLYYFDGPLTVMRGDIPLDDIVDVHEYHEKNPPTSRGSPSAGGAAFAVVTRQRREFYFYAESKYAAEHWVKVLSAAVQRR